MTASESDDMVNDCLIFLLDEVTVLAAESELLLVRFIFVLLAAALKMKDGRRKICVTFLMELSGAEPITRRCRARPPFFEARSFEPAYIQQAPDSFAPKQAASIE